EIISEWPAKTACQTKIPFLRYSSTKFRFWPKMPKVVSKESAISRERKCYRKSDLIFRIYDKLSFLYVS
mgnify:CR=1